jgi:hypothetical protein
MQGRVLRAVLSFYKSKRDLERMNNPLNYVLPAVSLVTYSCVNIGFMHFLLRNFEKEVCFFVYGTNVH